jgi:hypothetical protein
MLEVVRSVLVEKGWRCLLDLLTVWFVHSNA